MKKPVVLRIYKGDQLIGVKQYLDQQIVVGRLGEEVQVALDSATVSLIHASIEEREDGYYLCDLGSERGTVKNGAPVLDEQLQSGDLIEIGEFRIEFYIGAPRPKTVSTATQLTRLSDLKENPEPVQPTKVVDKTEVSIAKPVEHTEIGTISDVTVPSLAPSEVKKITESPKTSHHEDEVTTTDTPFSPVAPPVVSKPAAEKPAAKPIEKAEPKAPEKAEAKPSEKPVAVAPKIPDAPPPGAIRPPAQNAVPSKPLPPPPPIPPQAIPKAPAPTPAKPAAAPKPAAPSAAPSKPLPPPPPPAPKAPSVSPVAGAAAAGVASAGAAVSGFTKPPRPTKHKKAKKTFAPPSPFNSVKDYVKPSKGHVVEVLVAWRERVLSTYHFTEKGTFSIGAHPDNDIVLPILGGRVRKLPFLHIDLRATVLLAPDMTGELVRGQMAYNFADLQRQNRLLKQGAMYAIVVEQEEMVRLDVGDQVSVIVRYVGEAPKPLIGPLLDLTASETAAVVISFAFVLMLGIYMHLHTPPQALPGTGESDEPLRIATIKLDKPEEKPKPPPPAPVELEPVVPAPTPPPEPPKVTHATPSPSKVEKKGPETKPKAVTNLSNKVDPGKSANAAPNRNTKGPRELTSPKQGGSVKTANVEGSQMNSKKDVSKAGIFSTFGGGGANDRIDGASSGSGALAGLANAATGTSGFAENRPGGGLGSKLKDTGAGGTGKAFEGISGGVSTVGRGSGNAGYGTGGLGTRSGVKIVPGDNEATFTGTIDREAIRRVIQANLRVIRTCYERELNRHPDLFGKVTLKWTIGEQGRVLSAGVAANELGNDAVANCLVERLKTWRFPEPPGGQVVDITGYPFLFSN